MSNFLSYDNKVLGALGKAVDCFILSLLWFAFCIPLVTAGASTTALYYTVHKCIRNGKGYVARTFYEAFKDNFKESTLMWLIQMLMLLVITGDMVILYYNAKEGGKYGSFFFFFLVVWLFLMVWVIYTYAYAARFVQTKKGTMKNAAIFAVVHLPWSLLILLIFVVSVVICAILPILVCLVPAVDYILYDLILERIFRKYMSEEDLAKEQQDDMLNDNF